MDESIWLWILIAYVGITSYYSKHETKEFNEHSLRRMQYVESNLLKAQTKLDITIQSSAQYCNGYSNASGSLCDIRSDVTNALTDVRPELIDLHKKLED